MKSAAKKLLSDELIEERLEEQRRENEQDAAQGREYHPMSLVERRVIALYIVGILLGVAAGFAVATMLWGLNEVMP